MSDNTRKSKKRKTESGDEDSGDEKRYYLSVEFKDKEGYIPVDLCLVENKYVPGKQFWVQVPYKDGFVNLRICNAYCLNDYILCMEKNIGTSDFHCCENFEKQLKNFLGSRIKTKVCTVAY